MTRRLWPLATLLALAATLAVHYSFGQLDAVKLAYPHGDFGHDVLAFQFSTSEAQLERLFGPVGSLAAVAET